MNTSLEFYESNTAEEWHKLLAPANYHYHNGYIGERQNIFENPIYDYIFPLITNGVKVLDCGCGWGSVAKLLASEKQCDVTCVTNSSNQIDFISRHHKELKTIKADLNQFEPQDNYDVGLFIESFSHINKSNTESLLKNLSKKINNLLFIIHLGRIHDFYFEEWCMYFDMLKSFEKKLNNQGYKIGFLHDFGNNSLIPSYSYWNLQLDKILPTQGQLLSLHKICKQTLANPSEAAKTVGLFVIYASKNL